MPGQLCRALGLFGLSLAALAIDPGTARGTLECDGEPVRLENAYAYLHRKAGRPGEMRIALLDREVPEDAIAGPVPLPLETMARAGKAAGVLLRFDVKNQNKLTLTVLGRPGASCRSGKLNVAGLGFWKKWAMNPQRVTGEIEYREPIPLDGGCTLRLPGPLGFSAPLFAGP